jgi:phosphate butyryltransferase
MPMELLNQLLLNDRNQKPSRLAVAAAADLPVLEALKQAFSKNIVIPLLIGDAYKIKHICNEINFDLSSIEIIDEPDLIKAAYLCVHAIKENRADILMKGLIPTATLLKAVVSKDSGLRNREVISHFALFESPYYHKLLGITDAAMNISPGLDDKLEILRNGVEIMHKIGIDRPKVAVLGPLETINEKIESTIHATKLTQMNAEGIINGCIVQGPLALDNAISKEAAAHKGISGLVAGDADMLLVPDLNTGNVLYKSLIFMGGALSAAIITGAKVPIVLTSRADSEHSKLLSIALANKLISV